MTFTLLGMAAKLVVVAIETEAAIQALVEDAAGLVQEVAKNAIGTYEFGWPALEPETAARKATGDSPLLDTGEPRDSISKTIGHHVAWVGTDNDKAQLDGVRKVDYPAAQLHRKRRHDMRAADTCDGRRDGRRGPGETQRLRHDRARSEGVGTRRA